MKVAIVDHGGSNLLSLRKAVSSVGATPIVLSSPEDLTLCSSAILPGVGNFEACSKSLTRDGWFDALHDFSTTLERPLLGICLGMQLLSAQSSELMLNSGDGTAQGLSLIDGSVTRLKTSDSHRIPHVGWNSVSHNGDSLFRDIPSMTDFYFVHSYAFHTSNDSETIGTCSYGETFAAVVRKDRIVGTQFHPEKSSRAGLALLRNFVELI